MMPTTATDIGADFLELAGGDDVLVGLLELACSSRGAC